MTQYSQFIEAYRLAYPQIRKQLQYEQANKVWQDLKMKPEEFEKKFCEKMAELKVLRAKNNSQSLKTLTQAKLNFGRATAAPVQASSSVQAQVQKNQRKRKK